VTHCNECGDKTSNLKTLQAGEMQVLCEDCKEDLLDGYESGTDNAHGESVPQDDVDMANEPTTADPSIGEEWTVESIRDDWNALNVRLPDYLMRRFQSYHKRLDYELAKEGSTREFGKDRHYKPLVIALGLREVKEMNAAELTEALRRLEKNQIVE
jgi:hypothetical protein